jgi:hypothetical protein
VGPALRFRAHWVGVDLRLMNKAAFGASECPVLEAGTGCGNALDFHTRLAFRASRPCRSAGRQGGHLWVGHSAFPLGQAGALPNSLSPGTAEGGSVIPPSCRPREQATVQYCSTCERNFRDGTIQNDDSAGDLSPPPSESRDQKTQKQRRADIRL